MRSAVFVWLLAACCLHRHTVRAQVGSNACSALEITLPDSGSAWQGYDFPQAGRLQKAQLLWSVAHTAHTALPFAQTRQLGLFYQPGQFHAALYADFFGNDLFGWQQYQFQTGLSMGKWRIGAGMWSRRTQLADQRHWQLNAHMGVSGLLGRHWWWHLAFGQLRQTSQDQARITGSPPAVARVLLEHRPAKQTRIWLMYQQQQGWPADFGVGLQWQMNKRFCFDLAIAPPYGRFSVGLVFQHRNIHIRLQAKHQTLPGLWWGNQLQWTSFPP